MRAAIYARYSSDRQNARSVEDQITVCLRHAVARGWMVVDTFSDAAISGEAMANRPGLQAALAAAEAGAFDILLVEAQDRLARNLEHEAHVFNRLSRAGVRIATLTTDQVTLMEVAIGGFLGQQYVIELGRKTRRGMTANAEQGKATGSRLYGYRSQPGGAVEIVPEEAEVIREVFDRYGQGHTSRAIAADLNHRRIPGPRGGMWNASTLNGSSTRGNGILKTEQYIGVKVWNRMIVKKDDQGRRTPTMRPESEWRRTPVPDLRIVSDPQWQGVQTRLGRERSLAPARKRPAKYPFSGLLKCSCGANYIVFSGQRLACAANRERGAAACTNTRTIGRSEVERRILHGLRSKLLAPDLVEAYVRAYRQRWAEERAAGENRRRPLMTRLGEVERSIARAVDAICDGSASPAIKSRLAQLEHEKASLTADLANEEAKDAARPVELHPAAAEGYRRRIADLEAALSEAAFDSIESPTAAALIAQLRTMIDRIDLTPISNDARAHIEITVHGRLALFLSHGATSVSYPTSCGEALVAGGRYSQYPTSYAPAIAVSF